MYALLLSCAAGLGAAPQDDWNAAESKHLKNVKQVTSSFVRAGEGYFSPDGKQIVYQAEEKDGGNPFYQIFVQDLASGKFRRVSPGLGRTTCAFFHPNGKRRFTVFRWTKKATKAKVLSMCPSTPSKNCGR